MPNNILITGANGLLGRHCLESLSKENQVFAIGRRNPEVPISGVKYINIDLVKDWNYDVLPDTMDIIIHLAQSELFREFPDHSFEVFQVNVTSTAKLLDYAKRVGVKKFIFTSTGGIYDTSVGAVSENSPINTFGKLGNYFATKLCSEILTHNYTPYFDVCILRLFFMYGKGQKRTMLLPRLVDNVKVGKPITITKAGGIMINPVCVSDVVKVIEHLFLKKGSYTYNVAGPEKLTLKEIVDIIAHKLSLKPNYQIIDEEPDDVISNTDYLKKNVYTPVIRFIDGVDELL